MFDDSNGDYEGTPDQKKISDRSDKKITPDVFGYDLRLNTAAYIKFLEKLVLPWVNTVIAGRPYV